jgi:steroid 5-alpha reductase family enzyme
MDILALIATNLGLALVLFAGLWGFAQITRDPSFVDAFWAFGIAFMAVASFWLAEGWAPRQQVITGLVVIWGLRLGGHLYLRWRHEGADRRYQKLLADVREKRGWSFGRTTAFFVFIPQAVLLWITALPAQLGQVSDTPGFGVIAWIGIALAVFGIVYEALADWQLSRFKARPDTAGKVMDQGLWAWSRHPNYFGEAVTWWGIWLIGAETLPGLVAIAGPAFLTFTLTRWSGAPMLEAGLARTRPDYADYVKRVSPFIPWPPKQTDAPS